MLDDLRNKQKGIIWAIAIIFVAGMGLTGVIGLLSPKPSVGSIYGKNILPQDFDILLRQNIQMRRSQNPAMQIDDQLLREVNEQTWNQIVQERIFERELKRYRIRVRNRDVDNKFLNDPPAELHDWPMFQTNDEFDIQLYLNFVANNPDFALELEAYIRQTLPREMLDRKLRDQVIVTADSVLVDWLERNDRLSARLIFFDWNRVEAQEISDEEIEAFYNKNKKNYRLEASRRYRLVSIPVEPSDLDNLRVQEDMNYILGLIRDGADFGEMAETYSEDPGSAASRGSLGFFTRGRMVPEFEERAFSMAIGEVSEPFLSQFGWHILYVTDNRISENGEPEVEASHILMRVEPSDRTRIDFRNTAELLYERANDVGLEKAAEDMGFETRETQDFYRDTEFISGLGRFPHLVSEAFSRRVGYLVEPFELQDGSLIVAELSFRQRAHIQDVEQVKEVIRREIDREKRTALAHERAVELLATYPEEEIFDRAEEMDFRVIEIDNRLVTQTITSVGMDRDLKNQLFTFEAEQLTPVLTTERGSFIALITERNRPDMELFDSQLDSLTETLRNTRESNHLNQWYQRAREEAKITDYRYRFYPYLQ